MMRVNSVNLRFQKKRKNVIRDMYAQIISWTVSQYVWITVL